MKRTVFAIDAPGKMGWSRWLYFLLAEVYQKTGLKNLAAEEYGQEAFLRNGHAG